METLLKTTLKNPGLLEFIDSYAYLGGEIRLEKLNFLSKLIIKMVSASKKKSGEAVYEPSLNDIAIDNFITGLKS